MKKSLLLFYLFFMMCQDLLSQSGSPDLSFGINGIVTTDLGGFYGDMGKSVAIQADGKIVVAGNQGSCIGGPCDNKFALVRYNPDGTLDPTFGSGGKVTTAVGNALVDSRAEALVIQLDGKIVVVGYCDNGFYPTYNEYDFAMVRYNNNGTLDNTFGNGGLVVTDIRDYDFARSVALQTDGKILVSGSSHISNNANTDDFTLVRYNSNGTLDNTFGTGGKVVTEVGNYEDRANAILVQNDGKIILIGGNGIGSGNLNKLALVRYDMNGSLDNTFGSGGKVLTDFGNNSDSGNSAILRSDGKIIVAGYTYSPVGSDLTDFALVCYNTDGSLDSSFGSGGQVVTNFGSSYDLGFSIAMQSNGKMVVAGWTRFSNAEADFALVRYNSNGSLDMNFDLDGKVSTHVGDSIDVGCSVAIQADGKIVVAGYSYNDSTGYDFAVVRYHGNNLSISIPEETITDEILVYPNPSTGKFRIHNLPNSDVRISVYGVLGNCIRNIISQDSSEYEIDLSDLKKGIYFVEIRGYDERVLKRLILE